jgi:hypothetical protein
LKAKRMSGSKVRIVLMLVFVTVTGFATLCGVAAGQYCGPYPGYSAMPVTVATPCGAIASAGGVTACAGIGGAVASAGGIVAGASSVFPAAFAGPVAPVSPYYSPGLPL